MKAGTVVMRAGKLAQLLAATALRKVGPYLSNTVELALMAKAQVSQPEYIGWESWFCPLISIASQGNAGELNLVVWKQESCWLNNSYTCQVQIQGFQLAHP